MPLAPISSRYGLAAVAAAATLAACGESLPTHATATAVGPYVVLSVQAQTYEPVTEFTVRGVTGTVTGDRVSDITREVTGDRATFVFEAAELAGASTLTVAAASGEARGEVEVTLPAASADDSEEPFWRIVGCGYASGTDTVTLKGEHATEEADLCSLEDGRLELMVLAGEGVYAELAGAPLDAVRADEHAPALLSVSLARLLGTRPLSTLLGLGDAPPASDQAFDVPLSIRRAGHATTRTANLRLELGYPKTLRSTAYDVLSAVGEGRGMAIASPPTDGEAPLLAVLGPFTSSLYTLGPADARLADVDLVAVVTTTNERPGGECGPYGDKAEMATRVLQDYEVVVRDARSGVLRARETFVAAPGPCPEEVLKHGDAGPVTYDTPDEESVRAWLEAQREAYAPAPTGGPSGE